MRFVQPFRDPEIIRAIKKDLLKQGRLRDYAMFELGINTGLRISDILQLRKRDLKSRELYLTEIKTGKQKTFQMNPTVRRELLSLLKDWDDDDYIVKSREGVNKPITRNMAYKIIRRLGEEYNVRNVGTHSLRKTYGYFFYHQDKDIGMLQKIFNHSDPSFTLRYIGIIQDTMNEATRSFRV
ncbi:tyrosine-type recombinase/integrase [Paenibacillus aquistagni]|uniref:tyrosine-type recombinase/integrase n=1 Tax=Paenibacillus aquistagni TaxID=1852522 RepID=UPI000B50FDCE|nr:tyrosine-type recombinase/integrase [Paenibacillus aquistagni]